MSGERPWNSMMASENGEEFGSSQQIDNFMVQETLGPAADTVLEPDVKHHNGESCANKFEEDGDSAITTLLESFNTQRSNLEKLLQVSRDKVASGVNDQLKGTSCLLFKLFEIEVLIDHEISSAWTQLENISSSLESLVSEVQQAALSEARNKLRGKWKELQDMITTRTNSIRTAAEMVFPISDPTDSLCDMLDDWLKRKYIHQVDLTDPDLACSELMALQRSILSQLEVFKQLEHLDSSARDELNPADVEAVSKIMIYYQNQLEERRQKMQIRETVLNDLKAFLGSLRKIQSSIKCPPDQPEIQRKALREAAQEVARVAVEAKHLDERLKTVNISLEDAERGRKTCCGKLVWILCKELHKIYDPRSDQLLREEKVF